jgi:modulator of FtsH protease HflC
MKQNPLTLTIGALLIVIFALLLFTFQVRTTQVAVVTTFGRPTRDITESSGFLYFKWPWPIQKVYYFDKRVQNFEDKFSEGLTADNINLITSVYVGWRISDPKVFFPTFPGGSVPEAQKKLEGVLRTYMNAVVGKHPLSDFVSTSGDGAKFAGVENEILTAVQSQVRASKYGLEIEFIGINKLELPESVTQSVFERMTSERNVLISTAQSEGAAEATKIKSAADRKAAEMLTAADGQALEIRGKGEAEAAKSLALFQQNPQLASFLFRLTALEDSLKDRSTLIFDQQTPPFDLFRGFSTNLMTK